MSKADLGSGPAMYCRGCAYPLVGLDQRRCPECGQAFEPDDARTYANSPWHVRRRRLVRQGSVLLVLLLALYVASYAALVRVGLPQYQRVQATAAQSQVQPTTRLPSGFIGQAAAGLNAGAVVQLGSLGNPAPREANYVLADPVASYLYWPMNSLDRRVRPFTWNDFGLPTEVVKRWLDIETDVRASTDPKVVTKAEQALRLVFEMGLLRVQTPAYEDKMKQAIQSLDELKVLLDQATP